MFLRVFARRYFYPFLDRRLFVQLFPAFYFLLRLREFLEKGFVYLLFFLFFFFLVVLAVERAIPAQGNYAKGEDFARFLATFFEDSRAETYGKFVDFKAERFARYVMTEFVYGYHDEQNNDSYRYASYRSPYVSCQ